MSSFPDDAASSSLATENLFATLACERALTAVAKGWRARLFAQLYGLSPLEMFLVAQHVRDAH